MSVGVSVTRAKGTYDDGTTCGGDVEACNVAAPAGKQLLYRISVTPVTAKLWHTFPSGPLSSSRTHHFHHFILIPCFLYCCTSVFPVHPFF